MAGDRKVLVGVDGSQSSVEALGQALRLARARGASLHVIHVVDELVERDLEEALRNGEAAVRESLRAGGRALAEKALAAAGPAGVPAEIEVLLGDPADQLLRRADDLHAELIAFGAADAPDGVGSVARKVVQAAPCSVLLARQGHEGPWREVVACIDGSAASPGVLAAAFEIASRDAATVAVLHVFAPPWEVLHYRAPTREAEPGFKERYLANLHATIDAQVASAAASRPGLSPRVHVVEDLKPSRGILEFLRAHGADLAVVGTRGRSRIAYRLVGTTAERILSGAPCSVLAVRS